MKVFFALVSVMALAASVAAIERTDVLSADGGDIQITSIMHSSVQIEYGGKVIQIDPASKYDNVEIPIEGKFEALKPADLILVTDIHDENLDTNEIAKLRKPGAPVVMPEAVATLAGAKIPAPTTIMANGDTKIVAGVNIEAVPMYNLLHGRDPKSGELYHPKGRGNGYIITLGGKRLYHAGDTECTPEVRALKNIDVAFIPMHMPFTMTIGEAVECVMAFGPKIVYPYHYEGQGKDEALFTAFLKASPVEVRVTLVRPH